MSILGIMTTFALTELLGTPVFDKAGSRCGRVRELALIPQEDRARVAMVIVRSGDGSRMLPFDSVTSIDGGFRTDAPLADWAQGDGSEGMLLLSRDLLDQQVIDVFGRKVVRVNDLDLNQEFIESRPVLKVGSVDVGPRGAVRRLLKGVVPLVALRALLRKIPPRSIPWDFVDLIETDPARRVKLKISHDRLARLHPADIADIIEELTPSERHAVFQSLDEEVAAGALEEVRPKVQKSIVESLDSERAADIVEEMNPDAAADLLADLPEDRSGQILKEMQPEERQEVTQLLEFGERTAAGRMTTEFISVPETAVVDDAIEALKRFEGSREALSTIYLTGAGQRLVGSVPLVKIAVSSPAAQLSDLSEPYVACAPDTPQDEVASLFDKYNLPTLAA